MCGKTEERSCFLLSGPPSLSFFPGPIYHQTALGGGGGSSISLTHRRRILLLPSPPSIVAGAEANKSEKGWTEEEKEEEEEGREGTAGSRVPSLLSLHESLERKIEQGRKEEEESWPI